MGEVRGEAQVTQGLEALEQREDTQRGMMAGPRCNTAAKQSPSTFKAGIKQEKCNFSAFQGLGTEFSKGSLLSIDFISDPSLGEGSTV